MAVSSSRRCRGLQILTPFPSDRIARIELLNSTLHEIRAANDAGASPPYAHTFVIYNFPDRDCSAESSAGELLLEEDGLNRYKTEYIDPIVELLNEFHDIRSIIAYGESLCPGKIFRLRANSTRARWFGQPDHQHGCRGLRHRFPYVDLIHSIVRHNAHDLYSRLPRSHRVRPGCP